MKELRVFVQDSVGQIDLIVWFLVIPFFCGSAIVNNGNITMSLIGAGGIILAMFLVGTSVEILIGALRDVKGLGTITGFLTNGPETLVLVVGLLNNDIIFAASTPLGSNLMNVVLLVAAALLTRKIVKIFKLRPLYTYLVFGITICLAFLFFASKAYLFQIFWVIVVLTATTIMFIKRRDEIEHVPDAGELLISKGWVLPAAFFLVLAGFLLDGVVTFASDASKAPKGVIGFLVLATLTSWPEFKSTLSLLRRSRHNAALLNIVVSNISNLWLAAVGVIIFLLTR